ncbi:MAG: hypothetical protein JWL73_2109, partial [Actinomycetia bacterium]|nr:hypothetical protein [Actinomycetes bacterium]
HVLGAARFRADGHIGLVPAPNGFGTPTFTDADGSERQLRVEGVNLVSVRDGRVKWGILATLRAAAALAGIEPELPDAFPYPPSTHPDPDALLNIDTRSAEFIEHWYGWSGAVLESLRTHLSDDEAPSTMQLWPEHFDLAFDAGRENHRGTFGASPGDTQHPEPYLYVTPWNGPDDDTFWNESAFAGASLGYADLLDAPDPGAIALGFLRRGLDRL